MKFLVCLILAIFVAPQASWALDTSYERIELRWDSMRIRFFGFSKSVGTIKETELAAIKEGISYVAEALPAIRLAVLDESLVGDTKRVVTDVTQTTYTYSRTYYSDGSVRVDLESSLAKALAPSGLDLTKEVPSNPSENSGLIIQISSGMDPKMTFEIQDENGESLYRLKDVAAREFEKNFMGRFFPKSNTKKLAYFVGKNPLSLAGEVKGDRIIVVKREEWNQAMSGNYGLLERAKIAIVKAQM